MSGGAGRDRFLFDSTNASPGFGNDQISAFCTTGGRDFNPSEGDTLVFKVNPGFDPCGGDAVVQSGDWDGDGDALDVLVMTAAGSVLVEDFWEGAAAEIQAMATAGAFDSVCAINAYAQATWGNDMMIFN
ncbi:MAG: hypothetical protein WBO17_08930, partial [Sphingorhabdus sp.]